MSLLLKDDFHGIDQALNLHTPEVGGPWTITAGSPEIVSNKLHLSGACAAWAPFGRRIGQAWIMFDEPTFDADGVILMYLRTTDSSKALTVELLDGGITKIFASDAVDQIVLNPGTKVTLKATGNQLRFVLSASTITAWLNGVLIGVVSRVATALVVYDRLSVETKDADTEVDVTEMVATGLGTA